MIVTLVILIAVFLLLCWLISILPLPASPLPIRTILYCILIVVVILYLLRYAHIW